MNKQITTLLLLGFSGAALAQGAAQQEPQGAQPQSSQSAQPAQQQIAQASQVPSFDATDKNKDGQVSRAEAVEVQGLDFSEADANKNGSLDREEYATAMAIIIAPRR